MANNVTAGKPRVGGGIFYAPLGTTLPTDATTELADDFITLGFISEDGYTNNSSMSTEQIREWGGSVVLTPQTEKNDTFAFALLEAKSVDVLKFVYGEGNVAGTSLTTGITVTVTDDEAVPHAIVIDEVMSEGKVRRTVIPDAAVTELGEIVHNGSSAISYPITLTARKHDGYLHKIYMSDPPAQPEPDPEGQT